MERDMIRNNSVDTWDDDFHPLNENLLGVKDSSKIELVGIFVTEGAEDWGNDFDLTAQTPSTRKHSTLLIRPPPFVTENETEVNEKSSSWKVTSFLLGRKDSRPQTDEDKTGTSLHID